MSCNPLCSYWLYVLKRHASYVVRFNLFAAHFHPRPPLSTAMDTKIQALHQAGRAALEKAAKFLPKDAEAPPEVLRCECLQRSCVTDHFLCMCLRVLAIVFSVGFEQVRGGPRQEHVGSGCQRKAEEQEHGGLPVDLLCWGHHSREEGVSEVRPCSGPGRAAAQQLAGCFPRLGGIAHDLTTLGCESKR